MNCVEWLGDVVYYVEACKTLFGFFVRIVRYISLPRPSDSVDEMVSTMAYRLSRRYLQITIMVATHYLKRSPTPASDLLKYHTEIYN